jgi:hypothetical protein
MALPATLGESEERRKQAATGPPFFWLLFFGGAKKSSSPSGARPRFNQASRERHLILQDDAERLELHSHVARGNEKPAQCKTWNLLGTFCTQLPVSRS